MQQIGLDEVQGVPQPEDRGRSFGERYAFVQAGSQVAEATLMRSIRPATGATPSVRPRIEVSVEPAGSRATVPSQASCFFCLDPATVRVNDDPFCNRHASKAIVELLALLLNLAKGV